MKSNINHSSENKPMFPTPAMFNDNLATQAALHASLQRGMYPPMMNYLSEQFCGNPVLPMNLTNGSQPSKSLPAVHMGFQNTPWTHPFMGFLPHMTQEPIKSPEMAPTLALGMGSPAYQTMPRLPGAFKV